MSDSRFRIAPLGAEHDRQSFDCGEDALDRYFKTQATQDIRRRIANCYVATEAATGVAAGYYTIAAASIRIDQLPDDESKRLPRYPTVPAVRIGRLAVDKRFRGCGLGGALLADAAGRVVRVPPAVYALVVDAKNDQSAAFYRRFLFRPTVGNPLTLHLPVATAEKALLALSDPATLLPPPA